MGYLYGCIPFLGVLAQEVSSQYNPRYGGCPILLLLLTKLAGYHVDQQLQPQHTVSVTTTKTKSRHQEHKPVQRRSVRLKCNNADCWSTTTFVSAYLSQLSAGLGVCRGKSAMQKSSTVNIPSFFSAPYIAITLPEREDMTQRDEPSTAYLMTVTFYHNKNSDL